MKQFAYKAKFKCTLLRKSTYSWNSLTERTLYKFKFNNMPRPDLSGSGPGSSTSTSCICDKAGNRVPVKVTKRLSDQAPGRRPPGGAPHPKPTLSARAALKFFSTTRPSVAAALWRRLIELPRTKIFGNYYYTKKWLRTLAWGPHYPHCPWKALEGSRFLLRQCRDVYVTDGTYDVRFI